MINDADAAGIAEMRFGAGRGHAGVVFVLTLGTGIGSAVFVDGVPMPNTELGHLNMVTRTGAIKSEHYASERMRDEDGLSWTQWAARVNEYLAMVEALFSPDLFILGGGVSKRHRKFMPLLRTRAQIVPAALRNDAGIVGAAVAAWEALK
jgi:polyphosphate glucokinase